MMSEFAIQILKGTPIWVWAILAALIYLGSKQLKTRIVKRYSVLIAPIVFLFVGLMAAGRGPLGFATWAVSLISVAALTFFVWQPTGGARYETSGDRLHMPGSVVPMVLMLAIFLLNYVINVVLAINPAYRSELVWQVGPALILGALSGVFIGRAATLFRMNRRSDNVRVATTPVQRV
jgi:predicted neutral ceramidase superfamily lipid hydrolase